MTKQTNAFQKLILYIHEALEAKDSKVTESAMLPEKNIEKKILREVDVLIEKNINNSIARIAVECRDRTSKDDIQWVDSLIGKYLNLEVHKVIAVSNSGFSKSAIAKAKANNIELKTLEEALNIDFKVEFKKLGMATISTEFEIKQIKFELKKTGEIKIFPDSEVLENGKTVGILSNLVKFCFEEITKNKLRPYLNENFLKVYKTRADLKKVPLIEHNIPINGFSVKISEKETVELLSITFILLGNPKVNEVNVKRRMYNNALITEGSFNLPETDKEYTIFAAQTPKSNVGKYFFKSKTRK